jgi:hypothetical protein
VLIQHLTTKLARQMDCSCWLAVLLDEISSVILVGQFVDFVGLTD